MAYPLCILYGYELTAPFDRDIMMTLARTYQLTSLIPFPFTIKNLIPSPPINESPTLIKIIIGFIPGFIDQVGSLGTRLSSFLDQTDLFRDFNLLEPRFHCGIEWTPSLIESYSSSEPGIEIEPLYDSEDEIISGSPVFPKYFS